MSAVFNISMLLVAGIVLFLAFFNPAPSYYSISAEPPNTETFFVNFAPSLNAVDPSAKTQHLLSCSIEQQPSKIYVQELEARISELESILSRREPANSLEQ